MVRENNQKVFAPQAVTAEEPKFGAGSAFGKDQKVRHRSIRSCTGPRWHRVQRSGTGSEGQEEDPKARDRI